MFIGEKKKREIDKDVHDEEGEKKEEEKKIRVRRVMMKS